MHRSSSRAGWMSWILVGAALVVRPSSLRADEPSAVDDSSARRVADLRSPDVPTRRNAAYALWNARADAKAAIPALAAALRDADEYVRTTADKVLATFRQEAGGSLESAIPELVIGLADERVEVRRLAARNLWRSGFPAAPPIPSLIPALGKALDDADSSVRAAAAGILGNYGAFAADAVPALRRRASDSDAEVRLWVVQALSALGGVELLDALVAALSDADPRVRAAAAAGLGIPSTKARRGVPALVKALGDSDETVRTAAARAFITMSGRVTAPEAVPPLLGMLSAESAGLRAAAAGALGQLGDPRAVEPLARLVVDDVDASVRQQAAWSLGELGPEGVGAMSELITALSDSDATVASSAASAFAQLGALAPEAVGALRAAAHHADANVRHAALLALGEIGPVSAETQVIFFEALDDSAWGPRGQAVAQLGGLGADASPAVPMLVRLLGCAPPSWRFGLLVALARIGPAAKEAAPAVRALAVLGPDRAARARALASMAATPEDVAEGLADLTRLAELGSKEDASTISTAVLCLGELGEIARPARATLAVRFVMGEGLGWFGPADALIAIDGAKAVAVVERLREHARSGDSWGITVLAKRLPSDPETEKILLDSLVAEDPRARAAAVDGLGRRGVPSEDIIRRIASLRADPSGRVRKAVVLTLRRLGAEER